MPSFIWSQALTANGIFRPLDGWQYQYLPWPARVEVLSRATALGVRQVFTSGSETIVEESPTQAGGTAGVTPSALNTPLQAWDAAMGDLLKINYRETLGATPTVDGIIEVTPLI